MALFGRRKPGFSKEVELRPEDISDEFSDRNDPAMVRNDNPKNEKNEMAAQAEAVLSGASQAARAPGGPGPGRRGPWGDGGSVRIPGFPARSGRSLPPQ